MFKKIFHFTLILAGLTNFSSVFGQVPNWQWAKQAGGTNTDSGNDIAVDSSGNVYVTGYFESTGITFGSTTLSNAGGLTGSKDLFIAKYDASGNVLWARRAGGNGSDAVNSIALDDGGNCFVTGEFSSSTITFGSTTLTRSGTIYSDIFIAKYDSAGNTVWAKSAGGTNSMDRANDIVLDHNGNCYIIGNFVNSITFDSTVLTSVGSNEVFMAKYNANGNLVWANSLGGTGFDYGQSIAVDDSGNCYATGSFSGSTFLIGSSIILTNTDTTGTADMFILKCDPAGNALWAKHAGGSIHEEGYGIAIDDMGNSYVTGYFNSSFANFDAIMLTNAGNYDIFIAKYDASGNAHWAKSSGGSMAEIGSDITVDEYGNSYITGYFESPSISFNSTVLTNSGSSDIFIVKYDSSGTAGWAKKAGGSSADEGIGIDVDGNGDCHITGYFSSPSMTFGTTTLIGSGGYDFFAAKLSNSLTAVQEFEENRNVTIFPNPVEFQLTISSQRLINNIKVYNELGQCVINQHPLTNIQNQLIDVSMLPTGFYFVKVICGANQYSQKIIIK